MFSNLASKALKPGLGMLLDGVGPELAATATVTAALAIPGISFVRHAHADAAVLTPSFPSIKFRSSASTSSGLEDILVPRNFLTLVHPTGVALVFVKNIALQLLIKFNIYMGQLNQYEFRKLQAEEQGVLPPEPPKFDQLEEALSRGTYLGFRELGLRTVRLIYEHIAYRRLGHRRTQPFLRNGAAYLANVLHVRHTDSPFKRKMFSYTFAMLHANALFYAAEATVSVTINAYRAKKDRRKTRGQLVVVVIKDAAFQTTRCILLLVTTSLAASLGTMIKPGLGTRALPLVAGELLDMTLAPIGRSVLL